ncbi:MAG: cysteine--tRNA ligase [Candidatus Yanofskybacteria bacterium]|nr:cysteine--tRNA ligase [Candidatus Yanofskybacteria bacterium]
MMQIYNTLARQKEEFLSPGSKVRMFVCGPTVYDYSHIGHARTYVVFDVVAKYLRHRGYEVFYLQNITDIDDKIIERAKQKMINPADLALEYKEAYYEDMKSLGITAVSEYAPATQYIPEIVSQVKQLIEKGIAYLIEDDGYYFDLVKFPDYGKLSGRTTQSAEDAVSRIDESIKKRNRGDFALWKFSKLEEPGWNSELGYGRPGWHIEDTAMTEKHFGFQYDLHGGAQDLIFPHHEAEIAQMESISGKKPFVKYWIHPGFLTVSGQKMSKSLGNFITIRDALKKYPAEALRMMILMAYYRSPIDYSEENLRQTEAAVNRLAEFTNRLKNIEKSLLRSSTPKLELIEKIKENFEKEMDDDFNTPKAIASLFDFVREVNPLIDERKISSEDAKKSLEMLNEFDQILSIIPKKSQEIPPEIQKLISERETIRQAKDFIHSDQLRDQIKNLGYEIEDTNYGPLVKKLASP